MDVSTNSRSNLKISIESKDIVSDVVISNFADDKRETRSTTHPFMCQCMNDECECGCRDLDQGAVQDICDSLEVKDIHHAIDDGIRLNAIHVWGTDHLSTDDLMQYFAEYSPKQIEWIDDMSCNVAFKHESEAVRVLIGLSDPYETTPDEDDVDREVEVNDDLDQPPPGKWRKAFSLPEKTESLFLRFATKADVKVPGAEKRSHYYQMYGNPNYGGVKGLVSESYRRRMRRMRTGPDMDIRKVAPPKESGGRDLVVYDGLYSDTDSDNDSEDVRPTGGKLLRLDNEGVDTLTGRKLLASMSMVADMEEKKRKRPVASRPDERVSSRLDVHDRIGRDVRDVSPRDLQGRASQDARHRIGRDVVGRSGRDVHERIGRVVHDRTGQDALDRNHDRPRGDARERIHRLRSDRAPVQDRLGPRSYVSKESDLRSKLSRSSHRRERSITSSSSDTD